MPTRYNDIGKSGSRRSSRDVDGRDKTNKNNRSHHSRNHRHDSPVDRRSSDRYRGQSRDLTPPQDQYNEQIRRRSRPRSDSRRRSLDEYDYNNNEPRHHHDEDNRRHDRRKGHRRRQRSRDHRSRRKQRPRSSSLSSSSSTSVQDSHHHNSRRPSNRKRRRSRRASRRHRSRSHTVSEHGSYRDYYSRDRHDSRPDHHHQHHHHRNPLNDGAVRHLPPAGVVSDDDDGCHHGEHQQHHRNSQLAAPNTMGSQNFERRQQHNNGSHRNRNNKSKSNTKNNGRKKVRKGSPPPSNHDDTVGHFQGRDGCVIADRYRILKEVGVGTFGRVVECLDIKRRRRRQNWEDDYYAPRDNDGSYHHERQPYHSKRERERHQDTPNNIVAIKIVRNVKRYYDSAKIEADIIKDVNRNGRRGRTHCAVMYDTFSFDGHYCMVFECLGPSLYDFLKGQKYHPFPIQCVRDFARQLLETLEFLHSFGLIHTDLKPENILLLNGRSIPQRGGYSIPESTRIKVIDFGGATYDNEKKSSIVNTRQYRAPEVILGVGWSTPSDLWSVGCILAELYQGELLFATHDNIEHLALIERVIGPFPRKMLKRAKNTEIVDEAFDSSGLHRMDRVLPADKLSYVKKIAPLDSIVAYDEDAWFLSLLRRILIINPDDRNTAQECLRQF